MDALKDLRWPPALVVIAGLGSVVGLFALGADLTAIATFITSVGVAYGAYRLTSQGKSMERVEANTNGVNAALQARLSEKDQQLIEMTKLHTREITQMAAQLPAGASLPKTLAEDGPPNGG